MDDFKQNWDDLSDELKQEVDEDRLINELQDEFESDPDEVLDRVGNLGYELDDILG